MGDSKSFFITGTDTEVGKTFVTCELLRCIAAQGLRTIGMKPIASGGRVREDGTIENDDVIAHRLAGNVEMPLDLVNPYAFEPPVSPHIAALQAGVDIDFERIGGALRTLRMHADVVLVEAAGGWLAPVDETRCMADLAAHLGIPVILVVGVRLGCLNHAMLTVEAIQSRSMPIAGWIANCLNPSMLSLQHNLDYLKRQIPAPFVGAVPHGGFSKNTLINQSLVAVTCDEMSGFSLDHLLN